MFLLKKSFIFLLVTLVTTINLHIYADNDKVVKDPIYDLAFSEVATHRNTLIGRIVWDFDFDGIPDIACSSTYLWGNAGGPWFIYIKEKNNRYRYLGDIDCMHPYAMKLAHISQGTLITLYDRGGCDTGVIIRYQVTRQQVLNFDKRKVNLNTKVGLEQYTHLFGGEKPLRYYAEFCKPEDYLQNRHCHWKKEYSL